MPKHRHAPQEHLQRGLQSRHVQFIAIGGAIGVGLFLGAGTTIRMAGPAIMLSYIIGGLIIFVIMRALGEIAVEYPVSGSFSAYAQMFLGPRMGYITGWTYWFMWVVACMAEITAVGVYVRYWLPWMPQWIPALGALALMTGVNLIAVKAYGEVEFWFAVVKIFTIIAMIVLGVLAIAFGLGHHGDPVGLSNLWKNGGFLPNGLKGVALSMGMVMFAYVGTELIGVTAGEAADPEKTIPSAINKVFWRVLVFYVGSLFVITALYPWDKLGDGSPFVMVFEDMGIKSAAGIINFVVLTAALSSCNSGLFSTGRMLYNLSLQRRALRAFGTLNTQKVPAKAIAFSAACLLVGVLLNYVVPRKVFVYVTSVGTFAALWIWSTILLAQAAARRRMTAREAARLKFPMLAFPVTSIAAFVCLLGVAVTLLFNPDTRIAMIVGPAWIVLLYVVYNLMGWQKEDEANGVSVKSAA